SGNMNPGSTFAHTFAAAGSYDYYCGYHSGMSGTVVVLASAVQVRAVAGRQFSPATIAIEPGQSIIWLNDDTMDHTSTSGPEGSPDGNWSSGNLAPGATFAHTFAAAGTFPYYCEYHSGMVGQVVVAT